MAISTSANSASISTNEYFLFSNSTVATYQTADALVYGLIDFSAMVAGDQYRIRLLEKTNGGTAKVVDEWTLSGAQSKDFEIAMRILTEGYEVSVLRTAGSDRTIVWSLRSLAIDDLATAAAVAALPSAATIATAVFAVAHESGRTILGVMRRLDALMTGKATGLLGTLATFYRADGTTKAFEATQDTTLGTRETASTVGGD